MRLNIVKPVVAAALTMAALGACGSSTKTGAPITGPDGRPQPLFAGRYEDELVREDGRWRFRRRVAISDGSPAAPAAAK